MEKEKFQNILTAINDKQLHYFFQEAHTHQLPCNEVSEEEMAWIYFGGLYLSFDKIKQILGSKFIFSQETDASVDTNFRDANFFLSRLFRLRELPKDLQPLLNAKCYLNIHAAEHWGGLSEKLERIYQRASSLPLSTSSSDLTESILNEEIPETVSTLSSEEIADFKFHSLEDLHSNCTIVFLRGGVKNLIQMDLISPFSEDELTEMACFYHLSGFNNPEAWRFLQQRLSPSLLEKSKLLQTLRQVFLFYKHSSLTQSRSNFIFDGNRFKHWLGNELGQYNSITPENSIN